jgi:hypothetical protein
MNYELEKIWEETLVVSSRYYPDIYLEGLRKTTKSSVPAEILAENFPNKSSASWRYTDQ